MNHELAYGGYKFFQSSYRETPDRDQTILSVSKDPGEPIVFLGYYGLVAGMIIVLVTRIRERRRALQPAAAMALLALLAAAPASAQPVPPLPSAADVEALRRLPVQHDGRVMPLDTLAREAVWNVTGKRSVWGVDPVAMALGWAFDPRAWAIQPIVPVKDDRLAAAIGLPAGTRWSSFEALAGNAKLTGADERGPGRRAAGAARSRRSRRRRRSSRGGCSGCSSSSTRARSARCRPRSPARRGRRPSTLHSAADLRAVLDSGVVRGAPAGRAASAELLYNRVRPTRIAWWVLTLSLLLSIAAMASTAAPSTSSRARSSSPASRS